jgi:hypothetical protein
MAMGRTSHLFLPEWVMRPAWVGPCRQGSETGVRDSRICSCRFCWSPLGSAASALRRAGFEVAIEQTQNQHVNGSGLETRSVVVPVEAEGILKPSALAPDPAEATRYEAEEVACEVALQTIEKDLPAGVEPACRPSLIFESLPSRLEPLKMAPLAAGSHQLGG